MRTTGVEGEKDRVKESNVSNIFFCQGGKGNRCVGTRLDLDLRIQSVVVLEDGARQTA